MRWETVRAAPGRAPGPVQTPRGVLGIPRLHPHLHKLRLLERTVLKLGRKPWRHSPGEGTQLRRRGSRFPLWAGRGFLSSSCLLRASIPFSSLRCIHPRGSGFGSGAVFSGRNPAGSGTCHNRAGELGTGDAAGNLVLMGAVPRGQRRGPRGAEGPGGAVGGGHSRAELLSRPPAPVLDPGSSGPPR